MLHIVKQFMSVMTMGLKFGIETGSSGVDSFNQQDKIKISNLLSKLDINNDQKLDNSELAIKLSDNSELKEYLEKLGVKNLENNPALGDIISSLENFQGQVQEVRNITNASLEKLNISVTKFVEESSGKYYHNKAKDASGDYESPEEFLEDVDHNAAKILFSENKASDILKIIKENLDSKIVQENVLNQDGTPKMDKNGLNITKDVREYTFDGSSDAEDILTSKDKGYEADGFFGGDELHGLYIMAANLSQNEQIVGRLDDEGVFKMLCDFDGNGLLQTHNNFYMGELQSWYLGNNENFIGNYNNLYKNLGMPDIKDKLSKNFYATEQEFQLKLATYIQNGVKPAELFSENGLQESVTKMYEADMNKLNNFSESQKTYVNSAVEAKLNDITGGKVPNLGYEAELITLQSLTAVVGGAEGLAAGFDITELTDNIIDNLALGFVGGNFGIILSKNFYKENDISVTGSLLNFHVPILTVSYDMIKAHIDKKDLVYPELSETQTTAYASISTLGKAVGVQLNSVENDTQLGIEAMGSTLKTQLVEMIKVLKNNKDGENPVEIKNSEGNPDTDKQKYYDQYFSILKNIAQINNNILVLENTANSLVSSYKDEMYRNAEQNEWNFSSVGAGVIFASDILPLPYITAAYEDFTTQFNTVDHSYKREKIVTEVIAQETLQIETYNNKRVISLPNEYQISVPEGYDLQAEVDRNTIKIGGNIKSIITHEHVTQTGVVKTLVINGGTAHENGLYIPTLSANNITEPVTLPESSPEISSQLNEAINSTQPTRELINKLFSQETLTHPETKGAVALQKEIFNTLNNKEGAKSLQQVFVNLLVLVNNYLTPNYLTEIGSSSEELEKLKAKILDQDLTKDLELRAILQSVQSNFMEKNALVVGKNNTVTLDGYKTIADYDSLNKRGDFFDKIFENKYGQEFVNQIAEKREEWLTANGKSDKYTFTPSEGNLALTGVKLGSLSKSSTDKNTGVMAYEGVYNLAKVDGKPHKFPLEKNEAFVNNLPDSFLENVKNQLIGEGANVSSLDEVKNAINAGKINGIKIDYAISFARMGECLNDAIILDSFTITGSDKKFSRSMTSTMNLQDTDVDHAGVAYVDHVRMQSDNTQTQPTTDQNEVQTQTNVDQGNELSTDNVNSGGFNAGGNKTELPVNPETPVDVGGYNGTTISEKAFNDQRIAEGVATAYQQITNNENNNAK